MVDVAYIKIKAGNGGDGVATFRREKYIPKGGPDGGDGGNGGSVYFEVDYNMNTLFDFKSKKKIQAESGEHGKGKNMFGKNAGDTIVKVPVGTLVYEMNADQTVNHLIADLNTPGQRMLIAKGGRGGMGNYRFKSSTNRTPLKSTKGGKGQEFDLKLEVKLIADIGIIGFPNAGKTTLINSLCSMSAKVANYPFTTIEPNLGILILKGDQKLVLADIPGLIEGASEGKGLGFDFLRHVERTRMLLHMIDPSLDAGDSYIESALDKYDKIRHELNSYNVDLLNKPEIILINKLDIPEINNDFAKIKKAFKKIGKEVFGISAYTREGFTDLINILSEKMQNLPLVVLNTDQVSQTYTIENIPNKRMLIK